MLHSLSTCVRVFPRVFVEAYARDLAGDGGLKLDAELYSRVVIRSLLHVGRCIGGAEEAQSRLRLDFF